MKVAGYTGFVAYMEANNVPGFLLPLVIFTETGGGLLILSTHGAAGWSLDARRAPCAVRRQDTHY